MALTLITNPVGSAASKFFAGFQKCEIVFKREDLQITDVVAGTSGAKINHAGDLTSLLSAGDTIYLYSEGSNFTYDGVFEILTIVAGEITIDTPYIVSGSGGYINYLKNYYVELQCVNPLLPDVNILPFSLESDGDAAGNIAIDVSIANELNTQRGAIEEGFVSQSAKEFEIKYREVYQGSANSFTLIDNKLFIMLYSIDVPAESEILNNFETPKLFLGYPGALTIALKSLLAGSTLKIKYNELDINKDIISSNELNSLAADVNGFMSWAWASGAVVNKFTKYIEFSLKSQVAYDFAAGDFAYPDFLTEPIWYNALRSQTFTRNNCAEGLTPTAVSYTVPAKTYTSTISQVDADAQAQADIDANGQDYANANGLCALFDFACFFDAWHTQDGYDVPDQFDLEINASEGEFTIDKTGDQFKFTSIAGGVDPNFIVTLENTDHIFEVGSTYNIELDVTQEGAYVNQFDVSITGVQESFYESGHFSWNIVAVATTGIRFYFRRNLPITSNRVTIIDNFVITKI